MTANELNALIEEFIKDNNTGEITPSIMRNILQQISISGVNRDSDKDLLGLKPYSFVRPYSIGETCTYDGKILQALRNTSGSFKAVDWFELGGVGSGSGGGIAMYDETKVYVAPDMVVYDNFIFLCNTDTPVTGNFETAVADGYWDRITFKVDDNALSGYTTFSSNKIAGEWDNVYSTIEYENNLIQADVDSIINDEAPSSESTYSSELLEQLLGGKAGYDFEFIDFDELLLLKDTNGLKPGKLYAFSYVPVYKIQNTDEVKEGEGETFITQAIDYEKLTTTVKSLEYPDDEIRFVFRKFNLEGYGDVNGRVIYRKDTIRNNETFGYDFRNFVFRRWRLSYLTHTANATYSKYDLVVLANQLFLSLEDNNTNDPDSGNANWCKLSNVENPAEDLYLAYAPTIQAEWGTITANPTDYKDFYTFNTNGRAADVPVWDSYYADNLISNVSIGGRFEDNNIETELSDVYGPNIVLMLIDNGEECKFNTFAAGVSSVTLGGKSSNNNRFTSETYNLILFGDSAGNQIEKVSNSLLGSTIKSTKFSGFSENIVIGEYSDSSSFNNVAGIVTAPYFNSNVVNGADNTRFGYSTGFCTFKECYGMDLSEANNFYNNTLNNCGSLTFASDTNNNVINQCFSVTFGINFTNNNVSQTSNSIFGNDCQGNTVNYALDCTFEECFNFNFCQGNLMNCTFYAYFESNKIFNTVSESTFFDTAQNTFLGAISNCNLVANNSLFNSELYNISVDNNRFVFSATIVNRSFGNVTSTGDRIYEISSCQLNVPIDSKLLTEPIMHKNIALTNGVEFFALELGSGSSVVAEQILQLGN